MGEMRTSPVDGRPIAERVARGVCRLLADHGDGTLTEFRLANGRRVDVIGLNDSGEFVIVEVKSSVEDYRADQKWREYLGFCEKFYFAVPEGFPVKLLPADCGLMVADGFGAAIQRQSAGLSLNGVRKRHQLIRFGRTASARLQRAYDPGW